MALSVRPQPLRSQSDRTPSANRTLAPAILTWASDHLLQPDGPKAGSEWEYTEEQVRIIARWYAVDDRGAFVHRRGVLRRMKGWGKNPFLTTLAAVELCGPCRCRGIDPRTDEPIAIEHPAPWIQIAAVNLDQTRNSMAIFPGLFTPDAIAKYKLDIGKEKIYAHGGRGRIEAVTSSARALEGGRPSCVIADETQHWLPSTEGPAMMAAIRRNLGKSRDGAARVMEITNAHLVDEGSVAEATYEAWRQSDGKLEGVYYDATEAPFIYDEDGQHLPLSKWTDEQVRDALLAARGDSTWLDVDRILAEIRDPTNSESHSRRFYLNQVWSAANEEWLPVGAWSAREVRAEIPQGSDVILAVDGSYNDDSTGIVVVSLTEPHHVAVVECWEKPDAQEWTVPIDEVEEKIRAACKKWRVRELAFDPYRWSRTMQALQKEGLPVVEFPNSPERMITACQRFQTAVLNGTLTHSGDQRLNRHVGNVVVKANARGLRIVKESKWSPRKIDLAVAAVMAYDRAASRENPGAAWLTYMRGEISKSATPAPEPVAVAASAAPAAATPRDFLLGPEGSRPQTAGPCKHRWMREEWGSYCLNCQRCGDHPFNTDGVCSRCGTTRDE